MIGKEVTASCFKQLGVDESGLDETDKNYLGTILYKFDGGPVGIDTLCSAIGEGRNIVEQQIEPYLIYLGYINVTSAGREITEGGKKYLEDKKPGSDKKPTAQKDVDGMNSSAEKDVNENISDKDSSNGAESDGKDNPQNDGTQCDGKDIPQNDEDDEGLQRGDGLNGDLADGSDNE